MSRAQTSHIDPWVAQDFPKNLGKSWAISSSGDVTFEALLAAKNAQFWASFPTEALNLPIIYATLCRD